MKRNIDNHSRDYDENKLQESQKRLAYSERRFRMLFEQSPLSTQIFSPDGKTLFVNRAWEKLWGVTLDQIPQYNVLEDRQLVAKGIMPYIRRAFAGETVNIPPIGYDPNETIPNVTKNADPVRWVRAFMYPVKDEGQKVSEIVLIHEDITEQKSAERKILQANLELTRLNHMRSEFISMISHELRTPLAVIREGINLVLDGVDGPITPAQAETLGMSKNNVDRLARLIQNVLDFTKFEAGKLVMHLAETDLKTIMSEIHDFMGIATQKKGILLGMHLPEDAVLVVCDADKIRQVLINLMDNAIKFTPEGGRIGLSLVAHGAFCELIVEDSGAGIRKEDQARIFEMFEQSSGTRHVGGIGVGLAVCKRLAELHGGKIALESSPGQGSRFVVTLPRSRV